MIIDPRFNGPPDSANGGITCGLVAASLDADVVEVTLRRPPPLGRELTLQVGSLYDGEHLVASAAASTVDLEAPAAVGVAEAHAARAGYRGATGHPFPTCFVCGPERDDGLGLAPGPVADDRVAVDWTPAEDDPVLVWAALDCPGGWTALLPGRPMVLGRMALRLDQLPTPGDEHVVQGWLLGSEGRKFFTGSALYDASGRVLAVARATWITIA